MADDQPIEVDAGEHRFIAPITGPEDERVFTDSGIEIDRLYGVPLDEFVNDRDELAKRLRREGEREAADHNAAMTTQMTERFSAPGATLAYRLRSDAKEITLTIKDASGATVPWSSRCVTTGAGSTRSTCAARPAWRECASVRCSSAGT